MQKNKWKLGLNGKLKFLRNSKSNFLFDKFPAAYDAFDFSIQLSTCSSMRIVFAQPALTSVIENIFNELTLLCILLKKSHAHIRICCNASEVVLLGASYAKSYALIFLTDPHIFGLIALGATCITSILFPT